MKKAILLMGGLALALIITLTLIHSGHPPRDESEPTRRPLPPHTLRTAAGENVQIEKLFPGQDYLLLFFTSGSEASLAQLSELKKLAGALPDKLTVLLIHLGRINPGLPPLSADFQLLIDPEARLAQAMAVRTVPTLLLLTHEGLEVQYAETLVPAEAILNWFIQLHAL